MNCNIYIVSHKLFQAPSDSFYIPIFVGPNNIQYDGKYITDKTLKQIAEKNPNYCELTALYWIWKNVCNIDYVGFVHYRRYFFKNFFSKSFKNLIEEKQLINYMDKYDIVLPKKNVTTLTIREEYTCDGSGIEKDLEILEDVVNDLYPEYNNDINSILNGHQSYLYNMFFCKKELMNQYCEWLFTILEEVEKRVDISKYNKQQARIFGYMSERLMSVYVIHHHLKVKELPVLNIENKLSYEILREVKRKIKLIKFK